MFLMPELVMSLLNSFRLFGFYDAKLNVVEMKNQIVCSNKPYLKLILLRSKVSSSYFLF